MFSALQGPLRGQLVALQTRLEDIQLERENNHQEYLLVEVHLLELAMQLKLMMVVHGVR